MNSGDQSATRWSTLRRRDVRIGEPDSFGGQLVDHWRIQIGRAVATEIRISMIVGQNQDNIGRLRNRRTN